MRNLAFIILWIVLMLPNFLSAQYKVMFSNHYPPYNYIDDTGELVGFNIDILNAIEKLYDSEISVIAGTWSDINDALNNKTIHAIGGAHYPGSPDNKYIYTRSAVNTSHCFLYNTNFINDFSIEFLRSAKNPLVALWKNDVLIRYVLSINPSAKFVYVENYEKLIEALDHKEITCVLSQRIGSKYHADLLGKEYIQTSDHRILERIMGFKVSNDSPEFAALLNNGLEVILANGEYQRIYNKWIHQYNQSHNDWHQYVKYILIGGAFIGILFLLLLVVNWVLQSRIKSRTKDLEQQLDLNSRIMVELEKQKEKAEESDRMKSSFLANMSHEIRTPMNGILGFADLLSTADYSSEEQAQFITIIQRSGNRMLGTINNIIDVSKLESGVDKVSLTKVDVKDIILELYHFFIPEAKAKDLKLVLKEEVKPAISKMVTDEYMLNSILTNLIKNAIKFTNEGSITINYSIHKAWTEFSISDTGIGIAKDKQSSIFDQFVQGDTSHYSGYEGSGLGLSISKGYVDLLKGEIKVSSKIEVGTSFYVRIPNADPSLDNGIAKNSNHLPNHKEKTIINTNMLEHKDH